MKCRQCDKHFDLMCWLISFQILTSLSKAQLASIQPYKYQLSKSIVHEIKFGDIAVK